MIPAFRFLQLDRRGFPSSSLDQIQQNKVKDWLVDQRYSDPGEEAYVTRRDLGARRVEFSNSGNKAVKVKITSDPNTVVKWSSLTYPVHFKGDVGSPRGMDYVRPSGQDFPGTSFIIQPSQSVFIALNPYEGPMQYFHILDIDTDQSIGLPIEARHNAQIFVLRQGIQGWFFQTFQSTGFKA